MGSMHQLNLLGQLLAIALGYFSKCTQLYTASGIMRVQFKCVEQSIVFRR